MSKLQELSDLMLRTGAVVRCIPYTNIGLYEMRHQNRYPEGEIVFLPSYNREMLRVTHDNGTLGGKFLVAFHRGRGDMIHFNLKYNTQIFDNMDEVLQYLKDKVVNL